MGPFLLNPQYWLLPAGITDAKLLLPKIKAALLKLTAGDFFFNKSSSSPLPSDGVVKFEQVKPTWSREHEAACFCQR